MKSLYNNQRRFIYFAKLGIVETTDKQGKYVIQKIDDVVGFAQIYNLSFYPDRLESDSQAKQIFNTIIIEQLEMLNDFDFNIK